MSTDYQKKMCKMCGSEMEQEYDEEIRRWVWVCVGVFQGTCTYTEICEWEPVSDEFESVII